MSQVLLRPDPVIGRIAGTPYLGGFPRVALQRRYRGITYARDIADTHVTSVTSQRARPKPATVERYPH